MAEPASGPGSPPIEPAARTHCSHTRRQPVEIGAVHRTRPRRPDPQRPDLAAEQARSEHMEAGGGIKHQTRKRVRKSEGKQERKRK